MYALPFGLRLLSLSALAVTALGSRIFLFNDEECQDFDHELDGPNGYIDGQCSLLGSKGNFTSFKVVGLDRGCAVTVYGPDVSIGQCNPEGLLTTDLGTCYSDTNWTFYSIDGCTGQAPESSSSEASSATSRTTAATTASPTSGISSSTATTSSSSSSASALPTSEDSRTSATSSASSAPTQATAEDTNASVTPAPPTSTPSTAAIAGGVVGGIAGLALIIGGAWFLIRRRRTQGHGRARSMEFNELSGEPTHEIYGKEVPKRVELPNARYSAKELPPQELSAEEWRGGGGWRAEKGPSL